MEGWCLHQNTQKWLAHLLGVVHYVATTHRFGTIRPQSQIFAFFADPPFELWPPAKLPYVSAPRNLARWRRLSGPTSCMTSLTAGFGVKPAAPLQSQKYRKTSIFLGFKTAAVFFVVGSGWRNFYLWRRVPTYGAWPKRQSRKICPFGARSKNMQKTSILRGFCPPGKSWLRHCDGNVHYWAILDEIYQAKKTGSS